MGEGQMSARGCANLQSFCPLMVACCQSTFHIDLMTHSNKVTAGTQILPIGRWGGGPSAEPMVEGKLADLAHFPSPACARPPHPCSAARI